MIGKDLKQVKDLLETILYDMSSLKFELREHREEMNRRLIDLENFFEDDLGSFQEEVKDLKIRATKFENKTA